MAHVRNKPSRSIGDRPIIQRRQREEKLAMHSRNVESMKSMNSRAFWEDRGASDIKERQIQNTMNILKNQEESELHNRRLQLADLYNKEMNDWKLECKSRIETPEQRKAAMIKRAKELKQKRETERLKLVQEKRLQQYREACDDLRSLDSHRRTLEAVEGRKPQLEERQRQLDQERQYETEMDHLWEQQRQKKIQREEKDKQDAMNRNVEVKSILDLQVRLYEQRVAAEREEKELEDQKLIKLWQEQGRTEAQKERQLKMDEIKRAAQVKQFNRERAAVSGEAARQEREYDMKLLELALEREAQAEAKEKALQEQFKREAIEYQEMLKRQMEIEAEDLSYLDEIRKKMEDEVWEKRDAVHNAEARAREELLQAVLKSREEEIRRKTELEEKQKISDQIYMSKIRQENEMELQRELDQQEERARAAKGHSDLIKKQMIQRRASIEREQQEKFLEWKRMQQAEKQHQELVKSMAEQKLESRHKRKTAEWYFNS